MTLTKTPPPAPPTDEEQQAAFQQSMAFNSEAVRSGLFAAAMDIAGELRKAEVPQGEACLLTGAAEFVAQLWQQVAENGGLNQNKSRDLLIKEIKTFWRKHRNAAPPSERPATKH